MEIRLSVVTRPWNGAGTRVVIFLILILVIVVSEILAGWVMATTVTAAGLGCTLVSRQLTRAITRKDLRLWAPPARFTAPRRCLASQCASGW